MSMREVIIAASFFSCFPPLFLFFKLLRKRFLGTLFNTSAAAIFCFSGIWYNHQILKFNCQNQSLTSTHSQINLNCGWVCYDCDFAHHNHPFLGGCQKDYFWGRGGEIRKGVCVWSLPLFLEEGGGVVCFLLFGSASINGCLSSKVVFHKGLFSINGHLPSNIVFHPNSSSIKRVLRVF